MVRDIKEFVIGLGADDAGIADLSLLAGIETIPADLLANYTRAVAFIIQLSPDIFKYIEHEPTPLYAKQYAVVNDMLDHIGIRLQNRLLEMGYRSLAVPASQTVDRSRFMGHISLKAVAIAAGLGWQGKSLLLVSPKYGPRVRVACVMTDAPLIADKPLENRCGACTRCRDACPGQAIYGTPWKNALRAREEAIDLEKCVAHVTQMAQKPGIGANICGICIKVCPWSRVDRK